MKKQRYIKWVRKRVPLLDEQNQVVDQKRLLNHLDHIVQQLVPYQDGIAKLLGELR